MSTTQRQRENALVIAASHYPDAPPRSPATDEDYDWTYVLNAAEKQGVSSLLRQWLAGENSIVMPDWAGAALDATYWGQHFRNRFLLEAFAAVLSGG